MSLNTPNIALIGAGNMGSALIHGLLAKGHPPENIWATDPSPEKLAHLKSTLAISVTHQNTQALEQADILIFAVKPQLIAEVASELAPLIQKSKPLIISIAAGIRLDRLEAYLGQGCSLVRCMPNMPALLGHGATALYANSQTSTEQRQSAEEILACVGSTVWLAEESQMDAVTALSGSGPAYFFLVMEAMVEAGISMGLSEEMARSLCLQTAYGSALLAKGSAHSLSELRQQVTSPGGTTEAAIQVLEKSDLRALINQALTAAEKRSKELGST